MTDLHAELRRRVVDALGATTDEERTAIQLQPPKNPEHGDVALGCFQLAKLRGVPPPQLAQTLAHALRPDDLIAAATAAGPFLNIQLARPVLARSVITGVLGKEPPYGPWPKSGQSVVIDFSSPNIGKPFHLGHLRSTMIGAALRRMHLHAGRTVHGINHLGDWGAQYGKLITALERWGSEAALQREPMRHLFEIYARYKPESAKDPTLDAISARHFQRLESGEDNDERKTWRRLREISLRAFEQTYRRLGVEFDHLSGESFYEDKTAAAIERIRQSGVITVSDGAEVVELGSEGIKTPCLLRKTDGTTLYATRDLAAIFFRLEQYRFDRAIYVVGSEQKLHFQQLVAVLRRMGMPEVAERIEHVDFGLVLALDRETGKWGKLSTREGNVIFLNELLDEAATRVRAIVQEKAKVDAAAIDAVAEALGVSAIVFNDLKTSRIKDVKFDWDTMLSFEGDTGPYVQYAAARLASILRNAEPLESLAQIDFALLSDAHQVLLSMLEFGPSLERALAQSEPSVITQLMLRVAGEIHSYLHEHHVLRAEPAQRRARLALVAAARELLRTGLGLIGVASPDRM